MDRIKKNAKKIWNSKCKYLVIIACALILMNGVNLLQTSLKFFNKNGEEAEEIKSVEIESDDWVNKEPGSFHITKSADWTGKKEATIRFDLSTTKKTIVEEKEEIVEGAGVDIILVLDTSGSMSQNNKLVKLKEGAKELVNVILSEEGHKIALISFDDSATLKTILTNDKNILNSQINSLSPSGGTSYVNAYKAVINLLSSYEQDKNRDLVMLFLTDGEAGSAQAQYSILKGKYNISIIGIQYNMGKSIKNSIINISDKQYLAESTDISMVLFESLASSTNKIHVADAMKLENYETFEIEDYISEDFYVKSASDIQVSVGTVKLEESDGKQKVIWKLTENGEFSTGSSATMTIKATFKGELNPESVYPTNEKEKIKTKLSNEKENTITSELTPQLRSGYYVIYDPNFPSECSTEGKDVTIKKAYFTGETVEQKHDDYTCSGWQFKGWKIDDSIPGGSDNQFIIPSHDVKVVGIWTKVDLSKGMDGTIAIPSERLSILMKENAGTSISVDTSINFGAPSSSSNGRGLYIRSGTQNDTNPIYYYRGNVTNNHVLFAGICWQIVRTTETGGIKLIYNGVSNDGKTCSSRGSVSIGESAYGTKRLASVGYMKGSNVTNVTSSALDMQSSRYWGNDVSYDSSTGKYTLINVKSSVLPSTGYLYTCDSITTTCEKVYYALTNSTGSFAAALGVIEFTNGETLETYQQKIYGNTYNSTIKTKIDSWYKTNIDDKGYTKYLEDAVWCNDRTITKGTLLSKNTAVSANTFTYFGSTERRKLDDSSATPMVKDNEACLNKNDRFTVSTTTGNGALKYPVGMITADEIVLSGIKNSDSSNSNRDSYLSLSDYTYWTMTPAYMYFGAANWTSSLYHVNIFAVGSSDNRFKGFYREASINSHSIRPAISLRSDTLVHLGGKGTASNPYVVVMN